MVTCYQIELKNTDLFLFGAFIVFFITALIIGNEGKANGFNVELNILGLIAEAF